MKFDKELVETVQKMTQPGKGILAADESHPTLKKKFDKNNIENTEQNRIDYRHLLFTTKGLEKFISGVILYSETFLQTKDDKLLIDNLKEKDIVLGIKLDLGSEFLMEGSKEKYTKGLDDLAQRAASFYEKGARFAKWRCILQVGEGMPSQLQMVSVAQTLARYAKVCQQNGLVPIVEPELIPDGSHDINTCEVVSKKIFKQVFNALEDYQVLLQGCLFKPHMIKEGAECDQKLGPMKVAEKTVSVFRETLPANLGGVFFLSGGQSELQATNNLYCINKRSNELGKIWHLSFSFGRALQSTVVKTWGGNNDNVEKAQGVLMMRAEMNFKATKGEYDPKEENEMFEEKSLYEKNYSYQLIFIQQSSKILISNYIQVFFRIQQ